VPGKAQRGASVETTYNRHLLAIVGFGTWRPAPLLNQRAYDETKMSLHAEILEQPQRLGRLLQDQRSAVIKGRRCHPRPFRQICFSGGARTSDNAGRYAVYLWGL